MKTEFEGSYGGMLGFSQAMNAMFAVIDVLFLAGFLTLVIVVGVFALINTNKGAAFKPTTV